MARINAIKSPTTIAVAPAGAFLYLFTAAEYNKGNNANCVLTNKKAPSIAPGSTNANKIAAKPENATTFLANGRLTTFLGIMIGARSLQKVCDAVIRQVSAVERATAKRRTRTLMIPSCSTDRNTLLIKSSFMLY